jgi:hypothetical protein
VFDLRTRKEEYVKGREKKLGGAKEGKHSGGKEKDLQPSIFST